MSETDLNDADAVRKINMINGLEIPWYSVEGKSYSIMINTNLTAGAPGAVTTVIGLDGETIYTGEVSDEDSLFYSIEVE